LATIFSNSAQLTAGSGPGQPLDDRLVVRKELLEADFLQRAQLLDVRARRVGIQLRHFGAFVDRLVRDVQLLREIFFIEQVVLDLPRRRIRRLHFRPNLVELEHVRVLAIVLALGHREVEVWVVGHHGVRIDRRVLLQPGLKPFAAMERLLHVLEIQALPRLEG
jgi:hypothetical protein